VLHKLGSYDSSASQAQLTATMPGPSWPSTGAGVRHFQNCRVINVPLLTLWLRDYSNNESEMYVPQLTVVLGLDFNAMVTRIV